MFLSEEWTVPRDARQRRAAATGGPTRRGVAPAPPDAGVLRLGTAGDERGPEAPPRRSRAPGDRPEPRAP